MHSKQPREPDKQMYIKSIPTASTPPGHGWELMSPPGALGHVIPHTSSGPYGQPVNTVKHRIRIQCMTEGAHEMCNNINHTITVESTNINEWN